MAIKPGVFALSGSFWEIKVRALSGVILRQTISMQRLRLPTMTL